MKISMLINGEQAQARNGATFERRNPLDGSVATIAPAATAEDAVAAVEAAAEAFQTWSRTGPSERRMLLMKASQALEAKGEAFAAAVAAETGASAIWAGFNVHLAAGMLLEAAALTTQISGEIIPSDVPGNLAMGVRQPAGVVLGIAPWNAPVILAVRAIATPLACGNTVVLKGCEICPATHGLIIEALQEAGLPKGVVNFVTNAPADAAAVVEAMIAHPAVRRVNFTGSTHVGKLIAATCAKYLKPVVLELGGKAPLVVLDDADLDAAVNARRVRRIRQLGTDLHVDRADRRRSSRSPMNSLPSWQRKCIESAARRPAQGPGGARLGRRHEHGRSAATS